MTMGKSVRLILRSLELTRRGNTAQTHEELQTTQTVSSSYIVDSPLGSNKSLG
jgi:hypothetical protein